MEFFFAPMEGITCSAFRRIHHELFPGADAYYTPFIAPDSSGTFKPKFLRELTRDRSDSLKIVPQLLSNNAESFVITTGKLKALGFDEVNLNIGCPSATVFAKHKGAGMLADLSSLEHFLDIAYGGAERLRVAVSIKTRMGIHSTGEFPEILALYRKYPVSRLIIHMRDRDGLYQSEPDLEGFRDAFESCAGRHMDAAQGGDAAVRAYAIQGSAAHRGDAAVQGGAAGCGSAPFPITCNGNIFSPDELRTVTELVPRLESVMVGRGACANPALIRVLRGGAPLKVEELSEFHQNLIDAYLEEGICERFTLERMKQLWYYMIHMFADCKKEQKAILKSGRLPELRAASGVLFRSGKFNENGKFFQV